MMKRSGFFDTTVFLFALGLAAILPGRYSFFDKNLEATQSVSQVEPINDLTVFRTGDTLAQVSDTLGPPDFEQYIGCGILEAYYWNLPDGTVLGVDTEDDGTDIRVRSLMIGSDDGTALRTLENRMQVSLSLQRKPEQK